MKKPTINAETAEAAEKTKEIPCVLGVLGGSFSEQAHEADHRCRSRSTTRWRILSYPARPDRTQFHMRQTFFLKRNDGGVTVKHGSAAAAWPAAREALGTKIA